MSVYLNILSGIDKFNILQIKRGNIKEKTRLDHIQHELGCLEPDLKHFLTIPQIERLYVYLDFFNRRIWDLCDKVRVSDINRFESTTDEEYSTNCKNIIKLNDARFRVKNKINDWSFSSIKEQKNFKGNCLCLCFHVNDLSWIVSVVIYLSMCYDEIALDCDDDCMIDEFVREKNIYKGKFDFNHVDVSDSALVLSEKIKHVEKVFKFSYEEINTIYKSINKHV